MAVDISHHKISENLSVTFETQANNRPSPVRRRVRKLEKMVQLAFKFIVE